MFEEGAEAEGVTDGAAEAGFGVEGGKLAHRGIQIGLQGKCCREFARSLVFGPGEAALFEEPQHLGIETGSKLGIVSQSRRLPHQQGKTQPAENGANPIQAEDDEKEDQGDGKYQTQIGVMKLPFRESGHRAFLSALKPAAKGFGIIRGVLADVFGHHELVGKIVVDHPFVPIQLHPVQIETQARKQAGFGIAGGRSGVEGDPAAAGKIRFHQL